MEKLSEEDQKRIESTAADYVLQFDRDKRAWAEIDFFEGATSECLKKNEEIERFKSELYWQKEKEIEVSAERISVAVAEAITELESKLQVSEEKAKETDKILDEIHTLLCDIGGYPKEAYKIEKLLTKQ